MTQTTNYLSAKQNTPHCSWLLKKLIRDPRAVWAPFFVLAFRVIGLELTTKTRFFWFTKCNTVFSTYNGAKHFVCENISQKVIHQYLQQVSLYQFVVHVILLIIFLFPIIHSVHPPNAQLLKLLKTNSMKHKKPISRLFYKKYGIWQTLTRQGQRLLWCE